jgi:hypothetical protein
MPIWHLKFFLDRELKHEIKRETVTVDTSSEPTGPHKVRFAKTVAAEVTRL